MASEMREPVMRPADMPSEVVVVGSAEEAEPVLDIVEAYMPKDLPWGLIVDGRVNSFAAGIAASIRERSPRTDTVLSFGTVADCFSAHRFLSGYRIYHLNSEDPDSDRRASAHVSDIVIAPQLPEGASRRMDAAARWMSLSRFTILEAREHRWRPAA